MSGMTFFSHLQHLLYYWNIIVKCTSLHAIDIRQDISLNQMSALVAPSGECLWGKGLV